MPRYKMRQKMISLGEDFTIEDEHGNVAFRVDGKVMRIRETFVLEDAKGNEVATIRERKLSLHDSMNVLRDGDVVATITKSWFAPFRDKFEIDVKHGKTLIGRGNVTDHEYEISRDGDVVARISKKWFTFTDTYGIDVAAGEDDALILAAAVAIDELAHDPDEGRG